MDFQEIEVLGISGIEYFIVILNLYINGQMYQPENIFFALCSFWFLEKKRVVQNWRKWDRIDTTNVEFSHICINRPKISVLERKPS